MYKYTIHYIMYIMHMRIKLIQTFSKKGLDAFLIRYYTLYIASGEASFNG